MEAKKKLTPEEKENSFLKVTNIEDRIFKIKIQLQKDAPFYSFILMNMVISKVNPDSKMKTMAVNKYGDLYYNEEWCSGLSDEELKFTLLHEASHVATLSFQRRNKREPLLWNYATDIIINYMLVLDGYKAPQGVFLPDKNGIFEFTGKKNKKYKIDVSDKFAEQIYEFLEKNAEVVKSNDPASGDYEGGFDKHLDEGEDDNENDQKKNDTSEAGKQANEEKWKKKTVEANTAAKHRGRGCSLMDRIIDKILYPKINWKRKLYNFITKDLPVNYTSKIPSRRFYSTGIWFDHIVRENLYIVIGVDVSGSIGQEEYSEFISECIGISQGFTQLNMRIVFWSDYETPEDIEITHGNIDKLKNYKVSQTGGTSLTSFTHYCRKKNYKSRIFVIFTDGYIENDPIMPDGKLLFVLSEKGNDQIIKRYGEIAYLNP